MPLTRCAAIVGLALGVALTSVPPAMAAVPVDDRAHVAAINHVRIGVGLPPVSWCGALADAARAHAQDMASTGVLDHRGSDGSTPGMRARAAGHRTDRVGENIAVGYPALTEVMDAWLASPGHRANLVGPAYRSVGVATAVTADGVRYWVQVFGTTRRCR